METTLKEIVSMRLAELKRNAFEAARVGGLERSYVNDILIGKKNSVRGNNLVKLAKALDMEISDLVPNRPKPSSETGFTIPIVGVVSAGGMIESEWEQQTEPLYEIEIPFSLSDDAIGFEMRGESMMPKYDSGDIIVVERKGEPLQSLINSEAVVTTRDGNRYFKRIIQAAIPGLVDLESYNASMMRNIEITWGSGLIVRVPRSRWKKLNVVR